ncbi:MAG: 8-oxo-dGTP diphosphatase MutT [Cyanobacteriota bacterium]|nr:8-oxo-dGTP diphosphatase MutT [Cyanobacteriota bacterium]
MRQGLLAWWRQAGRRDPGEKPWMVTAEGRWPEAGEALDPLGVWVAEVMLQQTQLRVVLPYWRRWMEALPDLAALAAADGQTLLRLWQGMGYYSRARRLGEGARLVLARQAEQGVADPWPQTVAGWLELPGIGRSTAGGILSSAFDQPVPLLDGNVRRVLARLLAHPRPPRTEEALFWQWSATLLDPDQPRLFNQALMDLGATVCTPRRPRCADCPWHSACGGYAAGDPTRFPVKETSRPVPFQVIGVGVVLDAGGRVLIDQRLEEGLLGGLWEFPGGKQEPEEPIAETIARELREELAIEVEVGEELITVDHAYSHKRLRFVVHLCRWRSGEPQPLASQQVRWVAPAELPGYPFPAANARIIAALHARLGVEGAPLGEGAKVEDGRKGGAEGRMGERDGTGGGLG